MLNTSPSPRSKQRTPPDPVGAARPCDVRDGCPCAWWILKRSRGPRPRGHRNAVWRLMNQLQRLWAWRQRSLAEAAHRTPAHRHERETLATGERIYRAQNSAHLAPTATAVSSSTSRISPLPSQHRDGRGHMTLLGRGDHWGTGAVSPVRGMLMRVASPSLVTPMSSPTLRELLPTDADLVTALTDNETGSVAPAGHPN